MIVARTRAHIARARESLSAQVGLVPTMGALHAGHLALLRAARRRCDAVAASVFVNPAQFSPAEDYAAYPRDEARDLEIFAAEGVDLVLAPATEEMYPQGFATTVHVGRLAGIVEGASRPGHFEGVAGVVTKLFHLANPHTAYFGQKDWQQTRVVQRLIDDLNFSTHLVVVGTVRDPDGLALSSRNEQLSPADHTAAVSLSRGLRVARSAWAEGERDVATLERLIAAPIGSEHRAELDYALARHALSLEEIERAVEPLALLVAARVGGVRLIDNLVLGDGLVDEPVNGLD